MSADHKKISAAIDDEIELLEYVTAILRNKYRIVVLSFISACTMFGLTFLMPVKYESFARLALVEISELGGVSPDNRRAPEAMTLVEHDFISNVVHDNYQDRVIARMRSRLFTKKFIQDNDLLPVIFHKRWDQGKKAWKNNFKPDLVLAAEIFKENISSINRNEENNLMTVKIKVGDPQLAADIANKFVDDFNQYSRTEDIKEADRKISFLRQTLEQTDFVEMQQSLYRLIEAQLVIKMLANNKAQYALEILDPAIPPLYKASPARKRLTMLAFAGTLLLSIFFIISKVVWQRIARAIRQYQEESRA